MDIDTFCKELGLNVYKRKLYSCLLKQGNANATELCKKTGVPYGKVYQVLNEIESQGLISVMFSKPKIYCATEPKIAFKNLLEKKKEGIEEKIKLLKNLEKLPKHQTVENNIIVVGGREQYLRMLKDMIDRTEKEFYAMSGRFGYALTPIRIAFVRLLKRGCKLHMIVRKVDSTNREMIKERIKYGAEVKMHNLEGMRLSIRDNKEAIMSIVEPHTKERISIYTTNKAFVKSMKILFKSILKEGKRVL